MRITDQGGGSVAVAPEVAGDIKERRFNIYREVFRKLGVKNADELPSGFFERIFLLDENQTWEDEQQALEYAHAIFTYCERAGSANSLSPDQVQEVQLATMLTDIGKTGPAEATPEQRQFIAEIYSIRDNFNIHATTLTDFFVRFFPGREEEMKGKARDLRLDADVINMREFFNLHVGWTLGILREFGLPIGPTLTASTHHLLEHQNPEGIIDISKGKFQRFGIDRPLDQREVWVILLDKYDAAITRGKKTHAQAVEFLRSMVMHPKSDRPFANKTLEALPERVRQLFVSCVDDLDRALGQTLEAEETPGVVAA